MSVLTLNELESKKLVECLTPSEKVGRILRLATNEPRMVSHVWRGIAESIRGRVISQTPGVSLLDIPDVIMNIIFVHVFKHFNPIFFRYFLFFFFAEMIVFKNSFYDFIGQI